ncbi:MAG: GlsB/YeaQ/YmgE family stress response membrane protein [Dehalococcoidia bacterium]
MSIIAWIVIGLLAGALAKAAMPGNDPGGIIVTMLLGIAGALVGGWLAVAMGIGRGVDNFDVGSIVTATLGAIILLVVYRAVSGRRGFA